MSTDKDRFLTIFEQISSSLLADIQSLPGLSSDLKAQLTSYYSTCRTPSPAAK
jgi:hypothetical protein